MDQTVAASGAPGSLADPGAPGPAAASSSPSALGTIRWLRRIAGIVPFGVYVTLGLLLPMIAVAVGAFESNSGGFTFSNVSAATHRNTYVRLCERGRIVDAVSRHCDPRVRLKLFHDLQLLRRQDIGLELIDVQRLSD